MHLHLGQGQSYTLAGQGSVTKHWCICQQLGGR